MTKQMIIHLYDSYLSREKVIICKTEIHINVCMHDGLYTFI